MRTAHDVRNAVAAVLDAPEWIQEAEETNTLRAQLQTLGLWIAEALTVLDTVEPEETTEAELLTALIRRGEMLVLASLARGGALGPNAEVRR